MIVHVFETPEQASYAAAQMFAAEILKNPGCVMGLATGSTPINTYKQLTKWHEEGLLDFSECVSFNLDEYIGVAPDHAASYRKFMNEQLFDHINMLETYVPRGDSEDHQLECQRYDALIDEHGGIDIQFLGLGNNGHIGFNEPDTKFVYNTHIVDLTESTIQANTRFFDSEKDVPRQAISLGSGGIMRARKIVLVAFGEGKAEAVKYMVQGDIDPQWQGSILRIHPDVTVLLDEAAASKL